MGDIVDLTQNATGPKSSEDVGASGLCDSGAGPFFVPSSFLLSRMHTQWLRFEQPRAPGRGSQILEMMGTKIVGT